MAERTIKNGTPILELIIGYGAPRSVLAPTKPAWWLVLPARWWSRRKYPSRWVIELTSKRSLSAVNLRTFTDLETRQRNAFMPSGSPHVQWTIAIVVEV